MRMNDRQSMGCEMCKRQEVQFRHSETPFPECYSVAMSYVPVQTDTTVYDEMKALCEERKAYFVDMCDIANTIGC